MSLITTIIDGLAPSPSTGLGGANEGYIQGFQDDLISGTSGGVADKAGGQCAIAQNSPLGMSVIIADGVVYVPNADYVANLASEPKFYRVVIKAEDPITISGNSSGDYRYDAIDIVIDKNVVPNEYASNVASVVVSEGDSTEPPVVPDNGYRLAEIEVADGATQIITAAITDSRSQIGLNSTVIGEVVTLTGTQSLTNKTLTTPVIASIYQDAGKTKLMTLPNTASDTIVTLAATQALTNKTLTSPVINTGISGTAISAGSDVTTGTSNTLIVTPKALADAGISASAGTAFWSDVPGTPTRASDTQFTITDTSNANLYDLLFKKGTILRWLESTTFQTAMVISSSYGANTVTVNLVGDSLTAGFSAMKYAIPEALTQTFIIPGTLAALTDAARTWYTESAVYILSADAYVKTAGTTNATVFDINIGGSTKFTTKPSIASTATSDIDNVADTPSTEVAAGSLITVDIDSVSTTAPIEAYIKIFYYPSAWRFRN